MNHQCSKEQGGKRSTRQVPQNPEGTEKVKEEVEATIIQLREILL